MSATEASGGLNPSHRGVTGVTSGEIEVNKVRERLSDSSWSRTAGHSLCTWWWLVEVTRIFASSSNLMCVGVCVWDSPANLVLDQLVSKKAMWRERAPGIQAALPETQRGPASTWRPCKCVDA